MIADLRLTNLAFFTCFILGNTWGLAIIQLQERKRALARELITDDDGFVKTFTKEDVEYLFS